MPQVQNRRPAAAPFETYLREINETPLLDADKEKSLAYRIEAGDPEARDHLVRANLRLVVNIARGYAGRGLPLDDLIAEGNLGLLRAVEGFDPAMNTRFSTYASYWIKQSIKRALINTAKTVRLPAYMTELLSKWRRASAQLQEELGRTPTQEEVAQRLGLSLKKLKIIQKAMRIHNAGTVEDGTAALGDVSHPAEVAPDMQLAGIEEMRQVLHLLDQLDRREAAVLRLRFGLTGDDPRTLQEVGEKLGLTRERVRQIERDGLRKLRELQENS